MPRFWLLAPSIVLGLAACKVERTPRELIDRTDPVPAERIAVADELRMRLLSMEQTLRRGNPRGAFGILAPAPDVALVGPGDTTVDTDPAVFAALDSLSVAELSQFSFRELGVRTGPRADVAWFTGRLERPEPTAGSVDPETAGGATDTAAGSLLSVLRLSGVFLRREGSWELVQLHVSAPTTAATLPPNPPVADSLAPESAPQARSNPAGES